MYVPPYRQSLEKAFQAERDAKKNKRGLEEPTSEHELTLVPSEITGRPEGVLYKRYFVRYISTQAVFEITPAQLEFAEQDRDYKLLTLEWNSRRPKTTQVFGGYLQIGSNYSNYLTILKYKAEYPELYDIVVKDGTFSSVVHTSGGEFKDRQGRVFKGSYILDKSGEIFSIPDQESNYERKKLYLIDKIFTEFDR